MKYIQYNINKYWELFQPSMLIAKYFPDLFLILLIL